MENNSRNLEISSTRRPLRELYRQVMELLILLIDALMGIGMQRVIDRFRRNRSTEYRELVRRDIERLRALLA